MLWIFRLDNNHFLAECAFRNLCPMIKEKIWNCNIYPRDVKKCFDTRNLWGQVLLAWSQVNAKEFFDNVGDIKNQIIWWNSNILIGNKPVVWKSWLDLNIWFLDDLVAANRLKTHTELGVNWLDWASMMAAIPVLWKQWMVSDNVATDVHLFDSLRNTPNISRRLYNLLIDDPRHLVKYAHRWESLENIVIQLEDFNQYFKRIDLTTNVVKLRDFQYRLNLHKIVTNIELETWGIKDSSLCTFCNAEQESVVHLLFTCTMVQPFIISLSGILTENNIIGNFNVKNYLFNTVIEKADHIFNFLCVHLKQFLYKHKCSENRPYVKTWHRELVEKFEIDGCNARRDHNVQKYKKQWDPICQTITRLKASIGQ